MVLKSRFACGAVISGCLLCGGLGVRAGAGVRAAVGSFFSKRFTAVGKMDETQKKRDNK